MIRILFVVLYKFFVLHVLSQFSSETQIKQNEHSANNVSFSRYNLHVFSHVFFLKKQELRENKHSANISTLTVDLKLRLTTFIFPAGQVLLLVSPVLLPQIQLTL